MIIFSCETGSLSCVGRLIAGQWRFICSFFVGVVNVKLVTGCLIIMEETEKYCLTVD